MSRLSRFPQLRASLFDRMGFRDVLERLSSASTIAVVRDGRELAYHAIVFERLMVPTHGAAAGGDCVGPRWTLVAWRDGDDPGSFILAGGDFAQPIGARPGPCPGTERYCATPTAERQ